MQEREFINRFRLATNADSPWDRVLVQAPKPTGVNAATAILSHPTLGLKLVNGAGDMLDSLTKYVGDLLRYRSPVRYLYLSTYTAQKKMVKRLYNQREGQTNRDETNNNRNRTLTSIQNVQSLPPPTESLSTQIIQQILKLFI